MTTKTTMALVFASILVIIGMGLSLSVSNSLPLASEYCMLSDLVFLFAIMAAWASLHSSDRHGGRSYVYVLYGLIVYALVACPTYNMQAMDVYAYIIHKTITSFSLLDSPFVTSFEQTQQRFAAGILGYLALLLALLVCHGGNAARAYNSAFGWQYPLAAVLAIVACIVWWNEDGIGQSNPPALSLQTSMFTQTSALLAACMILFRGMYRNDGFISTRVFIVIFAMFNIWFWQEGVALLAYSSGVNWFGQVAGSWAAFFLIRVAFNSTRPSIENMRSQPAPPMLKFATFLILLGVILNIVVLAKDFDLYSAYGCIYNISMYLSALPVVLAALRYFKTDIKYPEERQLTPYLVQSLYLYHVTLGWFSFDNIRQLATSSSSSFEIRMTLAGAVLTQVGLLAIIWVMRGQRRTADKNVIRRYTLALILAVVSCVGCGIYSFDNSFAPFIVPMIAGLFILGGSVFYYRPVGARVYLVFFSLYGAWPLLSGLLIKANTFGPVDLSAMWTGAIFSWFATLLGLLTASCALNLHVETGTYDDIEQQPLLQ